jgi:hypothetical protein
MAHRKYPTSFLTRTFLILEKEDAPWPESADLRLQSYMHDQNCYIAVDCRVKIDDDIIDILTRGTQLATPQGKDRLKFMRRIRERVIHLTKKLINKVFLNCESGGTAV